jgi:hypothetical protein
MFDVPFFNYPWKYPSRASGYSIPVSSIQHPVTSIQHPASSIPSILPFDHKKGTPDYSGKGGFLPGKLVSR